MANHRAVGGRVAQLDGLRGVAVALVATAHFYGGAAPHYRRFFDFLPAYAPGGGLVGVQLFFVLSGYLITSLLLAERERSGRVSLRRFYRRRARRLVPALVPVCIFVLVAATLVPGIGGPGPVGGSVFRAATYTSDLDFVFRWIPDSGWLHHTWSLAVEEQFYLTWPAVLLLAYRWRGRPGVMIAAGIGIVATIVGRAVLWDTRVNVYETMRWDALMAGCILAVHPVRVGRAVAWGGAGLLVFYTLHSADALRPWDYVLTGAASAAVLVRSFEVNWLRNRALVHLGLISYGLYLWHAVILRFALPGPVSLALSLVAAELSYRLVEARFLRPVPVDVRPHRAGPGFPRSVRSSDSPESHEGDPVV